MQIRYVKRLEMVFDYAKTSLPDAVLPDGFFWKPWAPNLPDAHAQIIFASFRRDVDARVFPTFRNYELCSRLVRAIASKTDFVPKASWLIGREAVDAFGRKHVEYCASIQGLKKNDGTLGAIQNVATLPNARRRGLGKALVLKALAGFREVGCVKTTLEATAENSVAVRMYASLGFTVARVFYVESFVDENKPN